MFRNPRDLLKSYDEGFVGSWCDPEDTDKLLGELPHPLFGGYSDLYSSGEGKVALLYKSILNFDSHLGTKGKPLETVFHIPPEMLLMLPDVTKL